MDRRRRRSAKAGRGGFHGYGGGLRSFQPWTERLSCEGDGVCGDDGRAGEVGLFARDAPCAWVQGRRTGARAVRNKGLFRVDA